MATIIGTQNDDVLFGTAGSDFLDGAAGDDLLLGGGGSDEMAGGSGNDELYGEAGADRLYGGDGSDDLSGGDGQDALYGGNGADVLDGGAGSDRLYGGSGNDWLQSGLGDDKLYGGGGRDVFAGDGYWLDPDAEGHAVAIGFNRGADKVHIDNSGFVGGAEQFDFLDTNDDGRLDGRDSYTRLESMTIDGETKTSLVIDLGSFANAFDGNNLLDADQYTLSLYGVRVLEQADFFG